jgi:hypothetical protein
MHDSSHGLIQFDKIDRHARNKFFSICYLGHEGNQKNKDNKIGMQVAFFADCQRYAVYNIPTDSLVQSRRSLMKHTKTNEYLDNYFQLLIQTLI